MARQCIPPPPKTTKLDLMLRADKAGNWDEFKLATLHSSDSQIQEFVRRMIASARVSKSEVLKQAIAEDIGICRIAAREIAYSGKPDDICRFSQPFWDSFLFYIGRNNRHDLMWKMRDMVDEYEYNQCSKKVCRGAATLLTVPDILRMPVNLMNEEILITAIETRRYRFLWSWLQHMSRFDVMPYSMVTETLEAACYSYNSYYVQYYLLQSAEPDLQKYTRIIHAAIKTRNSEMICQVMDCNSTSKEVIEVLKVSLENCESMDFRSAVEFSRAFVWVAQKKEGILPEHTEFLIEFLCRCNNFDRLQYPFIRHTSRLLLETTAMPENKKRLYQKIERIALRYKMKSLLNLIK